MGNGTLRVGATRNQGSNGSILDGNAALDLYTQKILNQAQDREQNVNRVNARNQEIVYLGNSGEKQYEVNSFVGDDSANKNLIKLNDSAEYGHGEALGLDTFGHVGANELHDKKSPSKKKLLKTKTPIKTGFASFMDEMTPDRDNSQQQDDEWKY